MGKIKAAINISIDGFCDHTVGVPDKEIHQHYADLLNEGGAALYGRITYKLMEYWRPFVNNPTGDKAADEFAVAIDKIPKIVFSRTLQDVDWKSARLAKRGIQEEVLELKQQVDKDIFACSPSIILALTKLNLIEEFQLCIHPFIVGNGLPLFKDISEKISLKLLRTQTFSGGAVIHYYEPAKGTST